MRIKIMGMSLRKIFAVVLFIATMSWAVTRDLDREATIKESIVAHKTAKRLFDAQIKSVMNNIYIQWLDKARQLNAEAKAIRAEVESYVVDANATPEQAELVFSMVDNHLQVIDIENKQQSMELMKAVILLCSETITNEAIDPNMLNY